MDILVNFVHSPMSMLLSMSAKTQIQETLTYHAITSTKIAAHCSLHLTHLMQ